MHGSLLRDNAAELGKDVGGMDTFVLECLIGQDTKARNVRECDSDLIGLRV